eukprot:6209378-Amphidinium_carterae.1
MSPTRQNAIATAQPRRPRDRMQSPLHSKSPTRQNAIATAKQSRPRCKSAMQYLNSRRTARVP